MNPPNPVAPVTAEAVRAKAREVVAATQEALIREVGGYTVDIYVLMRQLTFSIDKQFEAFNYGEPERLDGMVAQVDKAIAEVNSPDQASLVVVTDKVSDWQGRAADNFHLYFAARFPYIAHNQIVMLGVLRNAIVASQNIMYAGRQSVLDIGDQTIAALKEVKERKPWWQSALPIVGAVLALAAAGAPLFGSAATIAATTSLASYTAATAARNLTVLGLVISAGGQAASVGNAIINRPAIGGGSVSKTLTSMYSALSTLADGVDQETEILAAAVNSDIGKLNAEIMLPHAAGEALDGAKDVSLFAPPPKDD